MSKRELMIIGELDQQLQGWKRLFAALAVSAGGELRIEEFAKVMLRPDCRFTFETFTDADTGDTVLRITDPVFVDGVPQWAKPAVPEGGEVGPNPIADIVMLPLPDDPTYEIG